MTESTTAPANPLFAYALPFVLFLLFLPLEQWEPMAEYYPLIYTAKIVVVSAAWWICRPRYPSFSTAGLALGGVIGVVGVVLWVALASLGLEQYLAQVAPWLTGERVGYDPWTKIPSPIIASLFLGVRFFGLAVVVPLIEEVFWRGFLVRYLIDEEFEQVPLGKFTPASFVISALLFAAVHPEILAAIVWFSLVNLLLYRTKNLWSCVVAHAVTNLLLGIYVVSTGNWWLW